MARVRVDRADRRPAAGIVERRVPAGHAAPGWVKYARSPSTSIRSSARSRIVCSPGPGCASSSASSAVTRSRPCVAEHDQRRQRREDGVGEQRVERVGAAEERRAVARRAASPRGAARRGRAARRRRRRARRADGGRRGAAAVVGAAAAHARWRCGGVCVASEVSRLRLVFRDQTDCRRRVATAAGESERCGERVGGRARLRDDAVWRAFGYEDDVARLAPRRLRVAFEPRAAAQQRVDGQQATAAELDAAVGADRGAGEDGALRAGAGEQVSEDIHGRSQMHHGVSPIVRLADAAQTCVA